METGFSRIIINYLQFIKRMKQRSTITVTPEKVTRVKELLERNLSLRNCAGRAGVSFYTAWHIKNGTYDTGEPLVSKFKKREGFFNEMSKDNWLVG